MKAIPLVILGWHLVMLPASAKAQLRCQVPVQPACAAQFGGFFDERDLGRCRREVETYRDAVRSYLACLQDESARAMDDLDEAIGGFNRRVRVG
ncbi:hypothetical protein ACFOD4_05610 [Pseudoroseomonas globiformis]|uniref:Uncharacterized protein n=1 Tax=Teichococcus globiformis TaxID=2307229 RepID=A0ABV7FVY1_9PROT